MTLLHLLIFIDIPRRLAAFKYIRIQSPTALSAVPAVSLWLQLAMSDVCQPILMPADPSPIFHHVWSLDGMYTCVYTVQFFPTAGARQAQTLYHCALSILVIL